MEKRQFEIKVCKAEHIMEFRARILRPGEELQMAMYEGDQDDETLHLAAYDSQGALVGCATFIREAAEFARADCPYRLRGMAAEPQGHGIGKELLQRAFKILSEKNVDLLWCKAREVAFAFYEALGFSYHGEMFEISRIGPHKMMFVWLNKKSWK